MSRMTVPAARRKVLLSLAGIGGLAASAGSSAHAGPAKPFPYDPACAWGRLSDGKGMMIRCLTEAEATALKTGKVGAPAQVDEKASPKPPDAAAAPREGERTGDTKTKTSVRVALGPINADQGAFPEGVKSLNKARERYVACIVDNGGLQKDEGELHIRFLVRERGRAEGATVKKRRGVSREAGKCVADVVDRRFVGYPDAPIVGATLVVNITKKAK